MKLRYDPYVIFRSSTTPVGLYARKKWLGDFETPQWQKDFRNTTSALFANQQPDGSWHGGILETITHLFGLHLTIRTIDDRIDRALTWLLDKIDIRKNVISIYTDVKVTNDTVKGLPFIPSDPVMLLTGATLFLATVFGRKNDSAVLTLYGQLCDEGIKTRGRWNDTASFTNAFRAMVVHPKFAKDDAILNAVTYLSEAQDDTGIWKNGLPFFHTLNALAHLDFPQAETQLDKAFLLLIKTQNNDGTWGKMDHEWNTFLTIHALKNKSQIVL